MATYLREWKPKPGVVWTKRNGKPLKVRYEGPDTDLSDGRRTGRWRVQVYIGEGTTRTKSAIKDSLPNAKKWARELERVTGRLVPTGSSGGR